MLSLKPSKDIRRSREMAWLVGTEAIANVFLCGDLEINPLIPLCPQILCPRPSWSVGDPA